MKTDKGTVRAADVVFSTNSPIGASVTIHTKQAPYRTYGLAAALPRESLADALYWGTDDPYHYVRLQPHSDRQDLVIIGREDHNGGSTARRRDNLLDGVYTDGALRTGCFLHHAVIATASIFSPFGPSTKCTTQVCRIRKQA